MRDIWKREEAASARRLVISDPNGIRTRVTGMKARFPRPLEDGTG